MKFATVCHGVLALVLCVAAGACGSAGHAPTPAAAPLPRPQTYGRADLARVAMRIVEIRMYDEMRFEPSTVPVHRGEVVTFRVVNAGRLPHEFTLGGLAAQDLHEAQMADMEMSGTGMDDMGGHTVMSMPHDKAHRRYMRTLHERITTLDKIAAMNESVHVPPGQSREVTWAFVGDEAPLYGCHVVGHFTAGMRGAFSFQN